MTARFLICLMLLHSAASLRLPSIANANGQIPPNRNPEKPQMTIQDQKVRGNWCTEDCFTTSEKQYLEEHAAELKSGLQELRRPGCMSKKKVLTGGYFRSASTLLFNQARLWMVLAFPKETAVGFDGSMEQFNASACVVSKQHNVRPEKASAADVLLMSRRDVASTIGARLAFFNHVGLNVTSGKWETVESKVSKNDLKRQVGEQCDFVMKQQKDVYRQWEKRGKSVAYDVLLEDFQKDRVHEIKAIAQALGICSKAVNDKGLLDMIQFMVDKLGHFDESDSHRITQMHQPTAKLYESSRPMINSFIKEYPSCNKWAESRADHEHNDFGSNV